MTFSDILARLLGLSGGTLEDIRIGWTAPWVQGGTGRLLIAIGAVIAWAAFFYFRRQRIERRIARATLTALRAAGLAMLLVILAEPVAIVRLGTPVRPAVWFLIDDTQSMTIRDAWSPGELAELGRLAELGKIAESSGLDSRLPAEGKPASGVEGLPTGPLAFRLPSRLELVRGLFSRNDGELLRRLRRSFRLRFFRLSRADGVDLLELGGNEPDGSSVDEAVQAIQQGLSASGSVTALGAALADLARRRTGGGPAALVVFSDFNHNAGPAPEPLLNTLGVPIYAVGLGKATTVDLAVQMQLPPLMKKGETASIRVTLRNQLPDGRPAAVRLSVRPYHGTNGPTDPSHEAADRATQERELGEWRSIGERAVELSQPLQDLDFPYTPDEVGHFEFMAEVEPLPEETVTDNNRAVRDNYVRDYFLRLLFIEDEPSWEWRFVKEVFHRDPLVGAEGFRTYLRSSDPRVRESSPLFLPVLHMPRKDFFSYDVVILGDVPADLLTEQFCARLEEFVSRFGGGLVLLAGPRFGPGPWARTNLEKLLPVQWSPQTRLRDRPFALVRTPEASLTDFMQLGETPRENEKAWANLGNVPWYYPVERVRPLAGILAAHPTDLCLDGRTPQPIVAIQRYGRGEVVYVGFNEWWRLRRQYGELYYRRFWGQLIHRLAMRHVLGTQKRFVVRTESAHYQAGDEVLLTVEAYDSDFQPLAETQVPNAGLRASIVPQAQEVSASQREVVLSPLRPGMFQARFRVFEEGAFTVRVPDPITGELATADFEVAARSVEMAAATRNRELQVHMAQSTGGRSYEITEADRLVQDLPRGGQREIVVEEVQLWNSWAAFLLVVTALLAEWFLRKWAQLA